MPETVKKEDLLKAVEGGSSATGMGEADLIDRMERLVPQVNKLLETIFKISNSPNAEKLLGKASGYLGQQGGGKAPDKAKNPNKEVSESGDLVNQIVEGLNKVVAMKGADYTVKELVTEIENNREMVGELIESEAGGEK